MTTIERIRQIEALMARDWRRFGRYDDWLCKLKAEALVTMALEEARKVVKEARRRKQATLEFLNSLPVPRYLRWLCQNAVALTTWGVPDDFDVIER